MLIKDIKSNRMRIAQWGNSVEKRGWIIQPEGKRKNDFWMGKTKMNASVINTSDISTDCI